MKRFDASQYGFNPSAPVLNDATLEALFDKCCNWGRFGADDEAGTLNFITSQCRIDAAALVKEGISVSLAQTLSAHESVNNPRPIVHFMAYEAHAPHAAMDFVGMVPHGMAITHLDALGHCYYKGQIYNGRLASEEVTKTSRLRFASILAQRGGIFTRGVLLDVARAKGVEFLEPGEYVSAQDLEDAAALAGADLRSGDAVIVHVGLEARERRRGPEDRSLRAGLDAGAVAWLHHYEVSLFSGDCIERMPYPSEVMPVPLHQIGLVAMGLVLLDCPVLTELVETARSLDRSHFLFTASPWPVPGATGSPVNPLAVF